MRLLLLTGVLAATANAYSPQTTSNGSPLRRTDAANVKFLVDQAIAPGVANADGAAMITADSDPLAALQAAADAWSNVSTSVVKFAPLETTSAVNNPSDNQNVIVFLDTPENRSVVGSALGVTQLMYFTDGRIAETDIIFSPTKVFSTNLAPKTYDLQSVATHEMGHALGANHSGLLSATMFQATAPQTNVQARLSADDRAFISDLYPAASAADEYRNYLRQDFPDDRRTGAGRLAGCHRSGDGHRCGRLIGRRRRNLFVQSSAGQLPAICGAGGWPCISGESRPTRR